MRSVACLLVLVAAASADSESDQYKGQFQQAYDISVSFLERAMAGAHPSTLVSPLRELRRLRAAGMKDLDHVLSLSNGFKRRYYFARSFRLWTDKFLEVTRPYERHPEKYKNRIEDNFPSPHDPKWNATDAYRSVETHINGLVLGHLHEISDGYQKMNERLKAKGIDDVTYSSWAKYRLERLLEDVERSMVNYGQYAKRYAANGDPDAIQWVKKHLRARRLQFDGQVQDIFKEYEENLNNSEPFPIIDDN